MNDNFIIRKMIQTEKVAVQKLAKKVFGFPINLMIGKPKKAIIATKNEEILGGTVYDTYNINNKKVGYLHWGFVDRDARGNSLGKKTYRMAVDEMKKECDVVSSVINFENTNSYRALRNNGDFNKVSFFELFKLLNFWGAIKFLFITGAIFGCGHDVWINTKENKSDESIKSTFSYFINNFVILSFFIGYIILTRGAASSFFINLFVTGFLIMFAMFIGGFIFSKFSKKPLYFVSPRMGILTYFMVSLSPFLFMITARWIPIGYNWSVGENKKELALSPMGSMLGLWVICGLSFLLPFMQIDLVKKMLFWILLLNSLPFLPPYAFLSKPIFRYNKIVYSIMLIINIILLVLIRIL